MATADRPTHRVDRLNIGFMLAACGLAFVLPFELFLVSYAVLGPLHYLTEISWLHQRGYFAQRRADGGILVALCALVLAVYYGLVQLDAAVWIPALNAAALGTAVAVVFVRDLRARAGLILASLAAGFALANVASVHDLLRVFLPTLIHVWLFTGAFILLGALRSGSRTGLASLVVFIACSAVTLLASTDPRPGPVDPDSYVFGAYEAAIGINATLAGWLGRPLTSYDDVYLSPWGRAIARFIAFAYTYHYLNWFSKTSIIQWHKIPRAWTIANIVLWLASVGLYAWDFRLGLTALFALSYLHVYLELPLNGRTFVGIGQQLRARVTSR